MGVRSLLAMALIDGAFICQHRFDAAAALRHIARERITSLYLVPTLYHDLVGHPDFAACDTSSAARCRKPVIAASRGYCFGVGFELALACDFRLVSETCLYSLPEQRLGQIPGSGGAARLQKMVGITRAKDIVMRSRRIPGRQAYEWGVATDCVADDELEAASDGLAEELRGFPPLAQRSAKKLINDIEDAGLSLAIELEGQCYGRLRSSDDFREGVEAFHQKRRPEFRGK